MRRLWQRNKPRIRPWLTIELNGGLLDGFTPEMRATANRRAEAAYARRFADRTLSPSGVVCDGEET